jgi:hypothetical protein
MLSKGEVNGEPVKLANKFACVHSDAICADGMACHEHEELPTWAQDNGTDARLNI